MIFNWFNRFSIPKNNIQTVRRKNSSRKLNGRRRLRLESLETRELLSVNISGYAVPDIALHTTNLAATPMATSSPTGYSPAQIRQAYGFNKIAFNNGTVSGDGSGTTIAIVDAYDDPNIASDLHQFDLAFGLPDPLFTKVNQSGGTTAPKADSGWASEIALDVEWAHAIAQKASILLVEASSSSLIC
jgi:subtilase family serine protease